MAAREAAIFAEFHPRTVSAMGMKLSSEAG
jgi:hypothetical protein